MRINVPEMIPKCPLYSQSHPIQPIATGMTHGGMTNMRNRPRPGSFAFKSDAPIRPMITFAVTPMNIHMNVREMVPLNFRLFHSFS